MSKDPRSLQRTEGNGRDRFWPPAARQVAGFGLGLAVLAGMLLLVDWGEMWAMLRRIRLPWLLAGGLAYLLSNLARSYRFLRLTRSPLRLMPGMMVAVLAMSLANQILPARLGELTYVYAARRSVGLPGGKGLVSLVVARLLDLLAIGLLFLVAAGLVLDELPREAAVFMALTMIGLGVVTALIAALTLGRDIFYRYARSALDWRFFRQLPGRRALVQVLEDMRDGLAFCTTPVQAADLLLGSLAVWLPNLAFFQMLLAGLGIEVPLAYTVVGVTFAAMASALPINSFGSFGLLELGWAAGFVLVGMEMELAVTTGLATHLLGFACALALGLPAWIWVLWRGRGVTGSSDAE